MVILPKMNRKIIHFIIDAKSLIFFVYAFMRNPYAIMLVVLLHADSDQSFPPENQH